MFWWCFGVSCGSPAVWMLSWPLLGLSLAVLVHSWLSLGLSWAALGLSWASLGRLLAPLGSCFASSKAISFGKQKTRILPGFFQVF